MQTNPADDLPRRVAELLVVRASGHLSDAQRRYPRWELDNSTLQRLLQQGVGGVILLGGSAVELQQRTQQLQTWSDQRLLFCADVEEGVGQRFEGASWLVPPLALGYLYATQPLQALALAERYGRCTADQARRCGLNWVLGPVCDVNNNPANPVINVRAWGEDPTTAGDLATAFQRGLIAGGVLGCAKHFPGHGDTSADSHLDLPVLQHDRSRLDQVELPPFRQLIDSGIDSVMTAHLLLPALDPDQPATLSSAVLTGLLRQQLHFNGLIVTDALVMDAISAHHSAAEAAVLAFAAGADLILMPADADQAIQGICNALSSGRIPMQRLEQSLQRRRAALQRAQPPLTELPIASGPEQELEEELVRACLQIQAHSRIAAADGVNLIRVDGLFPCQALNGVAPALQLPQALGFQPQVIHGQGLSAWQDDPEAPLALDRIDHGPVLLQLFLRGNPFRGSKDGQEPWAAVVEQLQQLNRLAGLVVYGSPYRWEELKRLLKPSIPAAFCAGQMPQAQQEVLNRLLQSGAPGQAKATAEFTD